MFLSSLNPFEFRAGIYFQLIKEMHSDGCLNPFEFRAGIYFDTETQATIEEGVLIPLNSGLVFT